MEMTTTRTAILVLAVMALGMFCIGKVLSPAYVFINDTPDRIYGSIFADTSPARPLDLDPGEYVIFNEPPVASVLESWEPTYLKTQPRAFDVVPTWNFAIVKIIWISKLPVAEQP